MFCRERAEVFVGRSEILSVVMNHLEQPHGKEVGKTNKQTNSCQFIYLILPISVSNRFHTKVSWKIMQMKATIKAQKLKFWRSISPNTLYGHGQEKDSKTMQVIVLTLRRHWTHHRSMTRLKFFLYKTMQVIVLTLRRHWTHHRSMTRLKFFHVQNCYSLKCFSGFVKSI